MTDAGALTVGPVDPTAKAVSVLRPLHGPVVPAPDGWLGAWQRTMSARTIPHCLEQLEATGTVDNVRRLTGEFDGPFVGFPFRDSDIYKTLEAIGWDVQRAEAHVESADELTELLGRAQRGDGYLDSAFQLGEGGTPLAETLRDGHELYCLGHLIQAAVAWRRATGDDALLGIAKRFADHVIDVLGDDPNGVDGHPEAETAFVELFRCTGESKYLDFASAMLDRRGHGALAGGFFGPRYYQDHVAVRESEEATGHAVRQIYLATGMVDVAVETHDAALLAAAVRLWESAHHTKMYVTGGLGARHRDESFGDAYELPAERAYAETCAAIADVHWSYRLLLATGDSRYADAVEHALLNAVAAGVSLGGTEFFYANPLQVRTAHAEDPGDEDSATHRVPWFKCPCCPPNVARLVTSAHHYVAQVDDEAVTVSLYASADLTVDGHPLSIRTGYPYDGEIEISAPGGLGSRALRLRIPAWCTAYALTVDGETVPVTARDGWVTVAPRNHVRLRLEMPARLLYPHPEVDAVRGCVAVARGPLVYALESTDLPVGIRVEDVRFAPDVVLDDGGSLDVLDGAVTVRATALAVSPEPSPGTFHAAPSPVEMRDIDVALVPYSRWGNRGSSAMRVWVPLHGLG